MKKRLLSLLLSALLLANLTACNKVQKNEFEKHFENTSLIDDTESNFEKPDVPKESNNCIEIQDFVFVSNGDGTCFINGLQNDAYKHSRITLTIPTLAPTGDIVIGIGKAAFMDCSNIEYVQMSDTITYIGEYAFAYCNQLKNIHFSNNLLIIKPSAFRACDKLEKIELPQKLISIGKSAFSCCYTIESVTIPDQVSNIGEGIFGCCKNLSSITVSKDNPFFYSLNNCIIEKETKSIIAGCKNSIIPQNDDITCISSWAFNFDFSSFTIPNNIKTIEKFGIYYVPNTFILSTIIFNGTLEEWYSIIGNDPHLNTWQEGLEVRCTDGTKYSSIKG